ncbi:MAG: RES domain-containing protein [Candidatus Omnitrophica bacterium]|nr:RES domain-containing protein [Candidatus Omnitrophota bacterium]
MMDDTLFPVSKPKKTEATVLDQFSSRDIDQWLAIREKFLRLHWDSYTDFLFQCSRVSDQLRESLYLASTKNFKFEKWQRTIKRRYSTEPLSISGSSKEQVGGRFNIADIYSSQIPAFPALYIAQDRNSSLEEFLCQRIDPGKENQALDFALAGKDSLSFVSVSGRLGSVINLSNIQKLELFVDLIRDFNVPKHVRSAAKELGIEEPEPITTVSNLVEALISSTWRKEPMLFEVPSISQIFGRLVAEAGIEGILYPSKFSQAECLAIFPQNFDVTNDSVVKLDDPSPPKKTKILKWDADTWRLKQGKII